VQRFYSQPELVERPDQLAWTFCRPEGSDLPGQFRYFIGTVNRFAWVPYVFVCRVSRPVQPLLFLKLLPDQSVSPIQDVSVWTYANALDCQVTKPHYRIRLLLYCRFCRVYGVEVWNSLLGFLPTCQNLRETSQSGQIGANKITRLGCPHQTRRTLEEKLSLRTPSVHRDRNHRVRRKLKRKISNLEFRPDLHCWQHCFIDFDDAFACFVLPTLPLTVILATQHLLNSCQRSISKGGVKTVQEDREART
jgi:hypothetical protein